MNRQLYNKINLVCGIDTFEIASDKRLDTQINGITTKTPLQECEAHGFLYKYKVNPDNIIWGASEDIDLFKDVLEQIKHYLRGAKVLYISRIDYKFDDLSNDYESFYKLNRLFVSLMANTYNAKNRYASYDLLTGDKLTVRFDLDRSDLHISAECYNKALQEPNGEVKTRLEVRSRQLCIPFLDGCDYESFLLAEWLERFKDVCTKDNFAALIADVTESIIDRYDTEKYEFGNLTEFIACYRDSIYTTRQLTTLYSILGNASTAKQAAYRYRHGDKRNTGRKLICFSLSDLERYVLKLTAAAHRFFYTQDSSDEFAA